MELVAIFSSIGFVRAAYLIHFPQLAPSREPSYPSPAGRARVNPPSLEVGGQESPLLDGPEQDMDTLRSRFCSSQNLWSFLIRRWNWHPRSSRVDSAGINQLPVPVFCSILVLVQDTDLNIAPFPNYWTCPLFRILFPFSGFCLSFCYFRRHFPLRLDVTVLL